MPDDRLLTISSFGRAVGLPASALRYYADAGILAPAEVDARSGYRYYAPTQLTAGVLVARLRQAEVPLEIVRHVVRAGPPRGVEVLEEFARVLAGRSEERQRVLDELVAELRDAAGNTVARTVGVPGPTLARVLQQVLRASRSAADDVAGVVWQLDGATLGLAATDRYWLLQHTLQVRQTGTGVSAFTSAEAAASASRCVARLPWVQVTVSTVAVVLGVEGRAPSIDLAGGARTVPDLGLLVARQPPRRLLTGFRRAELLEGLLAAGRDEPVVLAVHGDRAELGLQPVVTGWASVPLGPTTDVLLRPSLLAAAAQACVGDEVVVGLADRGEPLTVGSPDQPGMTALVMPMRA